MNNVEFTSAIISLGSLIVSCVAVYISQRNAREQGELAGKLQAREQDFERKKFIISLWDKMEEVAELFPDDDGNYDENDIFYALNTLELVAVCWESGIVDKRIVFLVFGDSYRSRVQEIQSIIKPLPILRRTGSELLQERQVILNVYQELNNMSQKKLA